MPYQTMAQQWHVDLALNMQINSTKTSSYFKVRIPYAKIKDGFRRVNSIECKFIVIVYANNKLQLDIGV